MKIAVSSKGAGLGAWIEPDLETCGFLMIVDNKFRFNAIENTGNTIDMISQAIGEGIEAIVAGSIKDEIVQILKNKGIKVYVAQQGSILQLVEQVDKGTLNPLK